MSLLRFRLKFEDYDDVHRDIDIKSDQTFADLIKTILESIGFDQKHEASFHMADHNWRKGKAIGVIKLVEKSSLNKLEIIDQIDDPHQKFLLEYDTDAKWQFTLELIKITSNIDQKAIYPLVSSSSGLAPVQYLEKIIIPTRERPKKIKAEDDEESIFEDDADLEILDNEAEVETEEEIETETADIADLPPDFEMEDDDEIEKLKNEMSGNIIDTSDSDDGDDLDEFSSDDDFGSDDDEGGYGGRNDYDE